MTTSLQLIATIASATPTVVTVLQAVAARHIADDAEAAARAVEDRP